MTTQQHEPTGTLLVVCTANICRSPLAARLFERGFEGSTWLGKVRVTSAGTRTEDGRAMCSVSAAVLPAGADDLAFAHAHRSRRVSKDVVHEADLVIAMEREQRSALAQVAPGSQAKVFTLREVEGLLGVLLERGAPAPDDLVALAAALHSVRGLVVPPAEPPRRRWFARAAEPADPLTIVDGHGLDVRRHEAAVHTVSETTGRVIVALQELTSRG